VPHVNSHISKSSALEIPFFIIEPRPIGPAVHGNPSTAAMDKVLVQASRVAFTRKIRLFQIRNGSRFMKML
jgi:hypothetical protein